MKKHQKVYFKHQTKLTKFFVHALPQNILATTFLQLLLPDISFECSLCKLVICPVSIFDTFDTVTYRQSPYGNG